MEVCKDGETVTVNSATVTAADLTAGNGVVHVIDGLVIPPVELPEVDPAAAEGEIVTAGSSTVGPLSVAIASQWEEEGATTVPTIDIIGSGAGFERFCVNAETDISNASRPIKDSEVESCQENGRNPIEFRVGTDAVAVTVSNDFVTDLSLEQLAQIFSGEVTNWNEVDSSYPDLPITLYIPGTDSGTFDFFVEVVLEEDEEAALAGNPQMSENDDVLVEGIAGDEGAIGYFGYAYYQQNQDILNIISIDGITANASTVDAFTYPLARPLFIYSDANIMAEKPQVAAFINYYLTNVNDVIGEVGYFPASADALNLARLKWQIATAQ
ncbi:MAG: phosphate ABC transporter substrate-binding protein PstS family protein [Chloroflexi bacterium]|nr:phosphate ABC transporter substrate-binding protein PstS family protein [Chloroflexota bacterium]